MDLREALQLSLVNECATLSEYSRLIGLLRQPDIDGLEAELQHDVASAEIFGDTISTLESLKDRNSAS